MPKSGGNMLETEKRNPRTTHMDKADTMTMLRLINDENYRSVQAVEAALGSIADAVDAVADAFTKGGRLIYVGAGTSGRIASADAAECPPTYGVDPGQVITIIAGGEPALTRASENAEDLSEAGVNDLLAVDVTSRDVVMGISASGGAAYVAAALAKAKEIGCVTISLSSNSPCKIADIADIAIFTDTGAEVITGSTRMKAGNAQKMVLNMITTCAMVKTGKVYENLMINLKPTNRKLKHRMVTIVADILSCDENEAEARLNESDWNIRAAVGRPDVD